MMTGAPVLVACTGSRLQAFPDLVDHFDFERQKRLYPQGLPLWANFSLGRRHLGWIAAVHGDDSDTAKIVRRAFDQVNPSIVVLEGFASELGINPAGVIERSLRRRPPNETAVAIRMAVDAGVPILGGEPSPRERVEGLLKLGFSSKDILFSSFFGPLEQDARDGRFSDTDGPAFEQAFADWAGVIALEHAADTILEAEAFRAWYLETYGEALGANPEWWARGWPRDEGVGGRIARESNRIRDVHAYLRVIAELNDRRRVLAVYGGSHLSSVWTAFSRSLAPPVLHRL
jgi:hypothetical protein